MQVHQYLRFVTVRSCVTLTPNATNISLLDHQIRRPNVCEHKYAKMQA